MSKTPAYDIPKCDFCKSTATTIITDTTQMRTWLTCDAHINNAKRHCVLVETMKFK